MQSVSAAELAELVELRGRVKDLEYVLTIRAAQYCGELSRPRAGVVLSAADAYLDRQLRGVARETLGLGDAPTVVHVVPNSPADRAGLQSGDVILAVDGRKLESSGSLARLLLESGERSHLPVRVQRGASQREVDLALELACPVAFGLSDSAMIVPWQHEKLVIAVPVGLVGWADGEDELAMAVAHQLAHTLFDRKGESDLDSESRADRMGLMLAWRAGYDVLAAPRYWERVAVEYPWLLLSKMEPLRTAIGDSTWSVVLNDYPHHEIGARLPAIRAIAAELSRQSPQSD